MAWRKYPNTQWFIDFWLCCFAYFMPWGWIKIILMIVCPILIWNNVEGFVYWNIKKQRPNEEHWNDIEVVWWPKPLIYLMGKIADVILRNPSILVIGLLSYLLSLAFGSLLYLSMLKHLVLWLVTFLCLLFMHWLSSR